MIFYMTSEVNSNRCDFLADERVFTKNTYFELQAVDMLNIIKQDLRNTAIEALIVDINIFKEGYSDDNILDTFEAFRILYPDSKVILILQEQINDSEEAVKWRERAGEAFSLLCFADNLRESIEQILDNQESSIEVNEILETEVQQEEVILKPEKAETLPETQKVNEEVIEQENSMALSCDDIYSRANDKVKTASGKPLLSQKIQEQKKEQPNSVINLNVAIERKSKSIKGQWSCSNIMVAVVGTERRTGTTTAAFHMAEYLCQAGAKVSYTEANQHFHLRQIAEAEGLRVENGHYARKNIEYYENTEFDQENGSNFLLLDMGSIQENTDWVLKIMKEVADLIIIVSTGKIYEQDALDKAVDTLLCFGKPCALVFMSWYNKVVTPWYRILI